MRNKFITGLLLMMPFLGFSQLAPVMAFAGTGNKPGFIENKGQIIDQNNNPNTTVFYLLNTPGLNVQLRKAGFSYDVYSIEYKPNPHYIPINNQHFRNPNLKNDSLVPEYHFHRIDINLQDANPNPAIETSAPSTDYLNYYTTGIPDEGVTFVKSFGGITYRNIYPGIDLQFINNYGIFEYNFLIQPGADIASIQLKVDGPERIKSFKEKIQMVTSIGDIDETIPLCYYSLNDIQVPVKGRFKKIKDHIYGFSVDQTIPDGAVLLIDPIPTRKWGTYLGGGSHEYPYVNTCKTDNPGNCIIGGYTNSSNNIASSGAHQVVFGGIQDGFLAKFLPDGQQSWCTYYGGSNGDNIQAVAIDNLDNIFIGGSTQSSSNIATTGAFKTILTGGSDAFFAKFTTAGIRLWGTYYGGSSGEWAYGCATDNLGNIYYAGITWSPDGIATAGAAQATFGGGDNDGFLTKFTGDGGIVWGTYYGGNNNEQDFSCTTDGDNHVFMTGSTLSPNNIATPGSFKPNMSDLEDAFLACFYLNGQRKWGTYFGGSSFESIGGVTANSNDEIYICGNTWSADNIGTSGTFQPDRLGPGGAFLAKFDTNCQRLWGTYYGSILENAHGCAVDDSGYVFMVGTAVGIDPVIVSPGAYQSTFSGISDGYFVKFDWNGQRIWGTYFGSTGQDEAMNIATDHNDNIYITG